MGNNCEIITDADGNLGMLELTDGIMCRTSIYCEDYGGLPEWGNAITGWTIGLGALYTLGWWQSSAFTRLTCGFFLMGGFCAGFNHYTGELVYFLGDTINDKIGMLINVMAMLAMYLQYAVGVKSQVILTLQWFITCGILTFIFIQFIYADASYSLSYTMGAGFAYILMILVGVLIGCGNITTNYAKSVLGTDQLDDNLKQTIKLVNRFYFVGLVFVILEAVMIVLPQFFCSADDWYIFMTSHWFGHCAKAIGLPYIVIYLIFLESLLYKTYKRANFRRVCGVLPWVSEKKDGKKNETVTTNNKVEVEM